MLKHSRIFKWKLKRMKHELRKIMPGWSMLGKPGPLCCQMMMQSPMKLPGRLLRQDMKGLRRADEHVIFWCFLFGTPKIVYHDVSSEDLWSTFRPGTIVYYKICRQSDVATITTKARRKQDTWNQDTVHLYFVIGACFERVISKAASGWFGFRPRRDLWKHHVWYRLMSFEYPMLFNASKGQLSKWIVSLINLGRLSWMFQDLGTVRHLKPRWGVLSLCTLKQCAWWPALCGGLRQKLLLMHRKILHSHVLFWSWWQRRGWVTLRQRHRKS